MIGDDYIIDRYKLKNSLNKWKFLALVFLFISIFTIFYHKSDSVSKIKPNYIANIEISGMILQNQEMIKSLNKLANDSNVKAVLVNINSTGGTGVGGESLYRELRRIAKNKPVVASIGEIGASAGYMIALGTDRIFAYDISLVGSIGVMIMNFEINELAKKHGINLELIKSSPLKGIPNYFEKLDNQQKEYVQNLANESNQYFIKLVKNRRNLSEEDLKAVSNGKIFIGTKAMKLKLIDQVGDMNDAIDWLKRKDDLKNLEVKKVNLVKATSKLEKLLDYSSDIKVIFSSIFNKILT
ncbi:signal peptide peptidase SppA [Candidatus Aquarickettsia rohweri]|uniref:Signal peptide peptidase SppA n=1 Tax=Candidatus Aquarickettsia rohweri TaxID=2602574 RepID=A0A429XMA9_9RICK|nr:signal peptide peptidase SppA [Candidatus Aquarickettsia rohweri]MSO13842.1 putative protease [Rickettsiales endosymbiont of Trichoplax sp. H2]RST67542.1 signal peptide peptidase SppA [Candidatus Aquarickettsia rohweri]